MDDPLKVTSITVETGYLCWMWIEEAYEIMNENDFNMLDESIRGQVLEGLFKQITLTLNPRNEKHWIKNDFMMLNLMKIFLPKQLTICAMNFWMMQIKSF